MSWKVVAATLAVALLVVAVAGQVARARAFVPPGRLIDVGGRQLHLHCTGAGPFTFVLDAGLNDFSVQWASVRQRLHPHRVCTVDRAGLGFSAAAERAPTAEAAVEDLAAALAAAGVEGPLVLVGHSWGALIARAFVAARPEQVAGLLLIDPAHEDLAVSAQIPRLEALRDQFEALAPLAKLGVLALLPWTIPSRGLEGEALCQYRSALSSGDHFTGAARETGAWVKNLQALRARRRTLADLPLVVLSRGQPEESPEAEREWQRLQAATASLSSRGRHLTVDCGHDVPRERPDVVVAAALELARQIESGSGWVGR